MISVSAQPGSFRVWINARSNYAKPQAPYVEILFPFVADVRKSPALGEPNEIVGQLEAVSSAPATPGWIQQFPFATNPDGSLDWVQFWIVKNSEGEVAQVQAGIADTHLIYASLHGGSFKAVLRREGSGNDVVGIVSNISYGGRGRTTGYFSPMQAVHALPGLLPQGSLARRNHGAGSMMRIELDVCPQNIDQQCDLLEAVCEIAVECTVAEIDAAPKDAFPCCVKCGKLQFRAVPSMRGVRNAPLTDAQRAALQHTVTHGHPTHEQVHEIEGVLAAHAMGTKIQAPADLCKKKVGTTLDLAIFQCAQERRRGKDCFVAIDWNEDDGNIHAYVKYADGTIKNPQDDTVPGGHDCGCGGKHDHAAGGADG